jgi:hypothetical protein
VVRIGVLYLSSDSIQWIDPQPITAPSRSWRSNPHASPDLLRFLHWLRHEPRSAPSRVGFLRPGFATERAERLRLVFAQGQRPVGHGFVDRVVLPHEPGEVPKAVLHNLG